MVDAQVAGSESLPRKRPCMKNRDEPSVSPTISRRLGDILRSQKPPTVREVQKLCKFYYSQIRINMITTYLVHFL